MKIKMFLSGLAFLGLSLTISKAQGIEVNAGLDIYSKYFWRGLSFGTGPQFQPTVSAKTGGLTLGAWGSFDAAGYTETDLFLSYATSFGLTGTFTDYSTGTAYFDTDTSGDHAFELALAYTIKSFTLTGAYIFNQAKLPGTIGGDTYVEAAYAFGSNSIAVGAGNGWYTKDTEFALCNVMFKTTKSLKFTESFSLPVTGIVMLNPSMEKISVGAGITF